MEHDDRDRQTDEANAEYRKRKHRVLKRNVAYRFQCSLVAVGVQCAIVKILCKQYKAQWQIGSQENHQRYNQSKLHFYQPDRFNVLAAIHLGRNCSFPALSPNKWPNYQRILHATSNIPDSLINQKPSSVFHGTLIGSKLFAPLHDLLA